MANECDVRKVPLGIGECTKMPQLLTSMITTSDSFSATEEQVVSATFWQDAIKAGAASRANVWPYFDTMENVSEEAVYEDTPLSYQAVRDGNYRFKFGIAQGLCLHKSMFTHRAKGGRVWLFDNEGQLTCTKGTDGLYRGLSIQLLNTEKLIFNDGSVTTKSPVLVALRNNRELDQYGAVVTAPFFYELIRLKDVTLTVISADADDIVVSATVTCDGTAVAGLEAADFVVLDGDGVAQAKTLSEGANGVYTLSATGSFVDGTVGLVAPSALSIDAYEAVAVAFEVGS
jgi:hypothetical protein